jgi:cytochrome c oxidase subunit 4
MTLSELRGVRRAQEEAQTVERHGFHPTVADYVRVAIILFIVTAIEVAIYYIPSLHGILVELLLALSSIKFVLVVLWYMHLRFDSKLFSALFAMGLAMTIALFVATLATLGAGLL